MVILALLSSFGAFNLDFSSLLVHLFVFVTHAWIVIDSIWLSLIFGATSNFSWAFMLLVVSHSSRYFYFNCVFISHLTVILQYFFFFFFCFIYLFKCELRSLHLLFFSLYLFFYLKKDISAPKGHSGLI